MNQNNFMQTLDEMEDILFDLENVSSALAFWEMHISEELEDSLSEPAMQQKIPVQVIGASLRGYHGIMAILVETFCSRVAALKETYYSLWQAVATQKEEQHAENQSRR